MTVAEVIELLASSRLDLSTEKACQADIASVLAAHLPPRMWEREFRLGPRDRPDFVIRAAPEGLIAVEVKGFRQRAAHVAAQLARYAGDPRVRSLVLMSNTAVQLPATIGGKPLRVISIGRAWL